MRKVILCSESGTPNGSAEIGDAHTGRGLLHLAFSVYVFTPDRKKILIQRRSKEKMLWPMIWANACCSHPQEKESPVQAGERRMGEELGAACALSEGPSYVYRAEDANRGVEHEYVTILIGTMEETFPLNPDPKEIAEWKWVEIGELQGDMARQRDLYAPWFHLGLPKVLAALQAL